MAIASSVSLPYQSMTHKRSYKQELSLIQGHERPKNTGDINERNESVKRKKSKYSFRVTLSNKANKKRLTATQL